MSGEEIFRVAEFARLAPPFIFMTAYGQIDQAVSLVRAGAHDYLTKPFELPPLFQKARRNLCLRAAASPPKASLGVSRQMRHIEALLRRMARARCPFSLPERPAPGKEVCARFLHQISPAAKGSVHGRQLRGDPRGSPRKRGFRT